MAKVGRPKEFGHAMTLRLPEALVSRIDRWMAGRAQNRAQAIRKLIEKGLERPETEKPED